MNSQVRPNEQCIIGLPRCGYVFSSARSCFIGYGFKESPLEAELLRAVLRKSSIEPVDAGESFTPAQLAFCTKICSKIMTSQFCAVLLNNERIGAKEIANANVQMEYGLMLGFNKYVIPFQRDTDTLSFNISGLDTKKYRPEDFKRVAEETVKQADEHTRPATTSQLSIDSVLDSYILSKRRLVVPLTTDGDRTLYELGKPLGYYLLSDFAGMNYMYFGNFANLSPGQIIWRVNLLANILDERRASLPARQPLLIGEADIQLIDMLLGRLSIWVLVASEDIEVAIRPTLQKLRYEIEVSTLDDVWRTTNELLNL